MSRDPQYNDIRQRMVGAVHEYHQHTGLIKRFITSHGQDINGWETWDVAPFHVLNARKGVPVPKEILHALNAAITGRSAVSDEFTEANTNPNIFMDASDISHRVFVEKLRTARRIWFPTVPENFSVTPSTSSGGSQNKGLRLIQTSTDEKEPTKVGIFSALAGSATGPEFYKVSFDKPIEMTIVSGANKRRFEVGLGYIKLTPGSSTSTVFQPKPQIRIPTLKQTAADVAAKVSAHLRAETRKPRSREPQIVKKSYKQTQVTIRTRSQKSAIFKSSTGPTGRTRIITRSMARSAKVKAVEEEQITISEDEVDEPEVHSPDTMPAVEPSSRTRANPFAASEYNVPKTLTAAPVPAFAGPRTHWIVDVSTFGDVTFYDPAGKSPITYIEEDEAKKKLQEILMQRKSIFATVKHSGRSYQLSEMAIEMLAADQGESIIDMIPLLIGVTEGNAGDLAREV